MLKLQSKQLFMKSAVFEHCSQAMAFILAIINPVGGEVWGKEGGEDSYRDLRV